MYVWNTGNPLVPLLVLLCPAIQVNGKLQLISERSANGQDLLGMKVQVTPPSNESQPAVVLVNGKGNMEWTVGEHCPPTMTT